MGSDSAQPQAQACGTTDPAPENSEGLFSFTPIKALRSLPRLWERKPSTPFRTGAKSRKLWKRFRSSFGGMQSLQSSNVLESDALQTAINASRDSSHMRGVKRQCVAPGESFDRDVEVQQPGRSFLETKWESEAMRKKRKLPDAPIDIYDESLQRGLSSAANQLNNDVNGTTTTTGLDVDGDLAMTASPQPLSSFQSPSKTNIFQDNLGSGNLTSLVGHTHGMQTEESGPSDQQQCAISEHADRNGTSDKTSTSTPAVRDLTQEQEGTLVRSALRSSLDGEDRELLNDFLSKAQAKRTAKKATISSEEADAAGESTSPEESPDADCATPQSRRALVALDTNSPSPIKVQISPSKEGVIPGDEARENEVIKIAQEDETPASPACRRSARAKAPQANGPPARNTIALRRAKGNEFVFLQRTEAQEVALATKRNTRQNKGNSVLPRHALEAMALQGEDASSTDGDKQSKSSRKGLGNGRVKGPRKYVSWNEERLAEYEDERQIPEESEGDVDGASGPRSTAKRSDKKSTTSHRSSRSQGAAELESGSTAPPAAPSAPTPRSRRVRRLGDSAMVSGTPVKTGSGRISKPPLASAPAETAAGPSTPTKARRKLVPKSPSSSRLPAPASKGTGDQAFVSGIPTRSAASSNAAANSEGTKRKSMLQASAGCTPMPKRVRSRS